MNRITPFIAAGFAAFVGLAVARKVVRRLRHFDWKGKRVVITGGSRGLGLVIGRELASRGARLAICSRTEHQLQRSGRELRDAGAPVIAARCDVREPDQVKAFIDNVADQWGGVDVVFNVAGIITVGPLDSMTMADFEDSMNTNCWGPWNVSMAALPYMRKQKWGRIVNVASLGGKRAIPHMLPYAASKFALVGLSNGMRAELFKDNIYVTTACPGLMRTGSPRNAQFKGQHRAEYAWFSIGDSLPFIAMDAGEAAKQIVNACQDGRGEVFIHNALNVTIPIQNRFPEITQELIAFTARFLPEMGGIGKEKAKGYESESSWSPSLLTSLTERAAIANNEI